MEWSRHTLNIEGVTEMMEDEQVGSVTMVEFRWRMMKAGATHLSFTSFEARVFMTNH